MNSKDLIEFIEYVSYSGVVLSTEHKVALQSSLCILKNQLKCEKVYFWGKLIGIKEDYFIAQCLAKNSFGDRTSHYSKDCITWAQLPVPSEESLAKTRILTGRFTGDPAHQYTVELPVPETPEEAQQLEPEELPDKILKEEDRLAAVIMEIDYNTLLVPRGSHVLLPSGLVQPNRYFEGLNDADAIKLSSYMHYRDPEKLPKKSLLDRANLDRAIDFMDTADEDIPKGSWSLHSVNGGSLIILRSLIWLGHTFFHVPQSPKFGSVYVGTGERNVDLPFML